MAKQFNQSFSTYGELAAIILSLPKEVQDSEVMFGDVRGDDERDAFSVSEIGTVDDANYIDQADETKVKRGTVMLFT